jgi:hypothetical protein
LGDFLRNSSGHTSSNAAASNDEMMDVRLQHERNKKVISVWFGRADSIERDRFYKSACDFLSRIYKSGYKSEF